MLPSQLQHLSFGYRYNQPLSPGVLPTSVTHLRLSSCFNHPLQPGDIPEHVAHLHPGRYFDHPLLPGVLPTSLRVLILSDCCFHSFALGSLPDGLEVLAFDRNAEFQHTLQPGVIFASVEVVTMSQLYKQELVAGGIPATVRWLRLSNAFYAHQDLRDVLSPGTRVAWWKQREEDTEDEQRGSRCKCATLLCAAIHGSLIATRQSGLCTSACAKQRGRFSAATVESL